MAIINPYKRYASLPLSLVSGALAFSCIYWFGIIGEKINAVATNPPVEALDTLYGFVPSQVEDVLESMGPAGRDIYIREFSLLDTFFPLIYSTFLTSTVSLIWPDQEWFIMLVGAIFLSDYVENWTIKMMTVQWPAFDERIAWAASVANITKHTVFAVVLVSILFGVLYRTYRFMENRSNGRFTEYGKAEKDIQKKDI